MSSANSTTQSHAESDAQELWATVPSDLHGQRLDQVAAQLFPDFSRARLQAWIKDGKLTVDGSVVRPREKVLEGAQLSLLAEAEPQGDWQPQSMDLDIVYHDDDLLVINKPAGLVVHPAAGNPDGTLLNGLLAWQPSLVELPRAGIVHRLDKDTSGLMVVARSLAAHTSLVAQLQSREVKREYEAIVQGGLTGGGKVNAAIGRHPRQRQKMAVVKGGKEAISHYRIEERYHGFSALRVNLATGRTHQIRVHMAHIGHPLVGDPLYGGRAKRPAGASSELMDVVRAFPRQALHALKLGLIHPASGEAMEWECALPEDIQALKATLAAGH